MTWQNCDDCGATLLVTIPYDGRSLCHTCWEDAKESGCGSDGMMGDNQTGNEPTTVTVSVDMFEQAIIHKRCNLCGGICINSGSLCQLCRERHMERSRKKHYAWIKGKHMEHSKEKHYAWIKGKHMENCQKMHYDMRVKEAAG